MANTSNLNLPLLASAQAQKHVTVNEALVRLDGLAQLRILSRSVTVPPGAADGAAYVVPVGGQNDWNGQDGNIAIFSNGGWVFATPVTGWSGYIVDEGSPAIFDGNDWIKGAVAATPAGAVAQFESIEISHAIANGTSSQTVAFIPANSLVFGVTGRVVNAIGGSATSFEVGVAGSSNRYGSGYGTAAGSFTHGLTGTPQAYYSDTALELTATGGTFDGSGDIILVAHVFRMTPPNIV